MWRLRRRGAIGQDEGDDAGGPAAGGPAAGGPATGGASAGPVARRLAAVQAELTGAAGGASLCAISRSGGGQLPLVKHLEGRMAALLEVRRGDGDPPDPGPARAVLRSWEAELADLRRREAARDWLAYRAGGVDELTALVEELEGPLGQPSR